MTSPALKSFYDRSTGSVSHIVWCPQTRRAALIDPVLDFDLRSGKAGTLCARLLLGWVAEEGLQVDWLLETHPHADRLSAAWHLRQQLGRGQLAIGRGIVDMQRHWRGVFNDPDLPTDGSPFDRLLDDGDALPLGQFTLRVLATPGHTPACLTYVVGDEAFVGDTLFMPDHGSARCDFPGGDAGALWTSVQRLYRELPPHGRMHLCHDYPPPGREAAWVTTVADQRQHNEHLNGSISRDDFVAFRERRDRQLAPPALLWPALQHNLRAGRPVTAEANGRRYFKLPVTLP